MRFYRSDTDRMLGGVCGGLANYLAVDVTWVRLFWVLLVLSNGTFTLIYLALWLLTPSRTEKAGDINVRVNMAADDIRNAFTHRHKQAGVIFGSALIVLGGMVLLDNLNIPGLSWLSVDLLWPVLLIVGGVALITRQSRTTLPEEGGYDGQE